MVTLRFAGSRIWEALEELARTAGETLAGLLRGFTKSFERSSSKPASPPRTDARIPAGRRVYAIGDVHGRADLLKRLLDDLNADARRGEYSGKPILIFLGDYVDRGFQSKDVLNILLGKTVSSFETYFLKGNHEQAMLQFLEDPTIGPRWAEYGGAETLVSYGVQPPRSRTNLDEWIRASADLRQAMPAEHIQFLQTLELSVRIGDYVFVHAGMKPGVPLDQQEEHDILWIRDEFINDRRPFEAVIVHGHTPLQKPYRDGRRIGLDTGAYLTGKLTAARFEHDVVQFITTGPRLDVAPGPRA